MEDAAGRHRNADLLAAELAFAPIGREQTVIVRRAILAPQHAAGAVDDALAGGVGDGGLLGLDPQPHIPAVAAAELSVAR